MARKSRISIDKYRLGKYPSLRTKDPYRLLNPYHPLSDPYRVLTKMRRGYKSSAKARLYSPSRRKGGSSSAPRYNPRTSYRPKMRYQPQPPYKPQPKPRAVRSSDKPWTEPTKSRIQPIRYQPDIERMLKQLEKRFDEKLEQEILERMETEFKELKAALIEKSEAGSKAQKKNIEAGPEEEAQDQLETTELIDIYTQKSSEKTSTEAQAKLSEQIEAPTQEEDEAELPIRDSSYDVEEKTEWLREQVENEELVEPNGQIEEIGQAFALPALDLALEANEPVETDQVTEQPAIELDEPMDEIVPTETDGVKLQQDIETILDQIEPLEPEQFEKTAPVEASLEPVATIEPEQPPLEPMMGDALSIEPTLIEPIDLLEQSADFEQIFDQIEPLEAELMQPFEPMILPEIMPLEDTVEADAKEAGYY